MLTGFLTGSRVYGRPRADSDIDLVLRVTPEAGQEFRALGEPLSRYPAITSESVRFGNLNLILCYTDEAFASWMKAKDQCILHAPINRHRAVEIHKANGV